MKALVIIPAFNEAESIVKTVTELTEKAPHIDYIVVNDGSTDETLEICSKHNYPVLDLTLNVGLAGAFKTGIIYALEHGYDAALQFDADGQHVPAYIGEMLETLKNDSVDLVIGSRFVTEKKPVSMRMLGSVLLSGAIKLTTGQSIKDPTSGMRLFGKKAIVACAGDADLAPEPDSLVYLMRKCNVRIKEVQVQMREREAGTSYLTVTKSASYMLQKLMSILFVQWFR